jgi:quinol monooxygenase YgiN
MSGDRQGAGCRQLTSPLAQSESRPLWVHDNEAAYQAHRATDHFKKYAATTGNMVAQRNARPMTPIAFNSKGH